MKVTKNGIPVFPVCDKVKALLYCVERKHDEDAIGHCADLVAFFIAKGLRLPPGDPTSVEEHR